MASSHSTTKHNKVISKGATLLSCIWENKKCLLQTSSSTGAAHNDTLSKAFHYNTLVLLILIFHLHMILQLRGETMGCHCSQVASRGKHWLRLRQSQSFRDNRRASNSPLGQRISIKRYFSSFSLTSISIPIPTPETWTCNSLLTQENMMHYSIPAKREMGY